MVCDEMHHAGAPTFSNCLNKNIKYRLGLSATPIRKYDIEGNSLLFDFFGKIRNGEIRTDKGKIYKSVGDYIKVFKAFWHWHQKVMRKRKIEIEDITLDLDASSEKPKWVYLDEEQFRKLCSYAKYECKVLMMFLFDSGIRSPTELINIKVSDLYEDCKKLNIKDEISKTFGRKINLMLCSDLLKEYIKNKELEQDAYLFPISPSSTNRYLKTLDRKSVV